MTDPMGGVVRYAYDTEMNLTSLIDQRNNTTSFFYDELDRVVETRNPLGHSTTMDYDAEGNVVSMVDRLGRTTNITYDALNRPITVQYADATVNYAYDAAGRRTSVNDTQSGTISWSYDNANRLLSETTPQGTVSYAYNTASERASMIAADRPPVSYTYDTAGRLSTISQNLTGILETFTYSYDILSRRTSLQRPNGVTTTYEYDEVNRLKRLKHQKGTEPAIEDFQYEFNIDDEISSISSLYSTPLFPDADRISNTADPTNRITQSGSITYQFDSVGQPISRTDTNGTTSFTWDHRGRLTQVTLPNNQLVNYNYDAVGRRISRTTAGVTTSFLYDNDDIVLDIDSNSNKTDYLHYPSIDEKLRQSSMITSSLYFAQDQLDSTIALTNEAGNVVERLKFHPFGESSNSSFTRFLYTGRERELLSELLYYRARWYDPQQGRFITEDPIELQSGEFNFYIYTSNNPINFIDPRGLQIGQTYPPPPNIPGGPWKWCPNPNNSRGGQFVGQGGASASWDPEGHWDVDNGKGIRQRYSNRGVPITPKQAHGYKGPKQQPINYGKRSPGPRGVRGLGRALGVIGIISFIIGVLADESYCEKFPCECYECG
jgi:RHS repeat-associated protein